MPAGQPLRGLVGQRMTAKRTASFFYAANFPAGKTTIWTAPRSRLWMFVVWGAGAGETTTSGAYAEYTRHIQAGQQVTVAVGHGTPGGAGTMTTVTFPDGHVVTCGGSANGYAATGGDVNINGSTAGLNGGGTGGGTGSAGGGAPGNLPFRGGDGSLGALNNGRTPGGGSPNDTIASGGDALVIVLAVSS